MVILNDFQSRSTRALESRAVSNVSEEIDTLLGNKTYDELESLEDKIRTKLGGDEPVDVDYWQQLLRSLKVWKAKARLRTMHDPVRKTRPLKPPTSPIKPKSTPFDRTSFVDAKVHDDLLEDNEAFSQAAQAMFDDEKERIAGEIVESEENFNVEADDVEHPEANWSIAEFGPPRKPKFFNRVVMGYEWNQYNKTHYDENNPPPKVVQGYKFNIFYPNLVDITKAPTYKVERNRTKHMYVGGGGGTSAGEDETCIVRFTAGPPYLDVAFRIIDRDWDYSSRFNRGFKSSFDKVFHVFGNS
jgi:Cactus-binding C-terminus of cactin protein/Conserved mid region of cactin